jgi:hypothetical protein
LGLAVLAGLPLSTAEVEVASPEVSLSVELDLDTFVLKLLQLFEQLWKQMNPLRAWLWGAELEEGRSSESLYKFWVTGRHRYSLAADSNQNVER